MNTNQQSSTGETKIQGVNAPSAEEMRSFRTGLTLLMSNLEEDSTLRSKAVLLGEIEKSSSELGTAIQTWISEWYLTKITNLTEGPRLGTPSGLSVTDLSTLLEDLSQKIGSWKEETS